MNIENFLYSILLLSIGGYFAWRNGHKTRVATAAAAFRGAFATELSVLESRANPDTEVRKLLLASFKKHSEAVITFGQYLSWFNRRSFSKAWGEYHYGQQFEPKRFGLHGEDSILLQYVAINVAEEDAARVLAIKNIKSLLHHAQG